MNGTITVIVSIVAVVVVAGILFAGLWNMFRGGEGAAIVVILGALFFFGRGAPPA